MPELTIKRLNYSHNPWRIGLETPGGVRVIAEMSFARKRDAVPILEALQALNAPWGEPPETWPRAVLEAARAIKASVPSVLQLERMRQEAIAPGRCR